MSHNALTALAKSLPASVPFVGPETQERALGRAFSARLGANESQFGPSPRSIEAMAQAAQEVWQYGDPENHDLKQALAAHHNIDPGHITLGEGIDGLLLTLTRLTVASGDAILTSHGAYPTFNYHAAGNGGTLHMVPYLDDHEDPRGLAEQARRLGAKLVYFANPDNPMGSWHSADTVQELIDNLPKSSLLVLDEAYIELAPNGTAPDLRPETDNVIRLRTFSKAYGMAGSARGLCHRAKIADLCLRQTAQSFRPVANFAGRSLGGPQRPGLCGRHQAKSGEKPRDPRADCPRQWPHCPALSHKFRHDRLRQRWRFCPRSSRADDRTRFVYPHAFRGTDEPLHSHLLRR